jgi:mRNA-degrading endonuclease RelE of RelBE toxin-antitoxin system
MTFEINIKEKSLKFISSLQKHDRERLLSPMTKTNLITTHLAY